ncbi:nucleotidyltransferase family protein [Paenibacillus turpanensis]|uniref:nucleotidyltransferase family protein n=1 Tax=Paenibacillus turpanensis TaxID=2689078 RepID=UPI00140A63CD
MEKRLIFDNDRFSMEMQVMLRIMSSSNDAEIKMDEIHDEKFDWALFTELVIHHRVYPYVYHVLKKRQPQDVPSDVMQKLYMESTSNMFMMMNLTRELHDLSVLFDTHHIRMLTLKGPILAEYLYGDITLRTSKDVDVLVPLEEVENAEKLLLERGYVEDHDTPRILDDWKTTQYHLTYTHPVKRIQVELHWRTNRYLWREPSFEELWIHRRTSEISGAPIHFLGSNHLFMYLSLHGARHGWFRLRWLTDIDRLLRKEGNWEQAVGTFDKYHCHLVGGQTLQLLSALFHTPIPQELFLLMKSKRAYRLAFDAAVFFESRIEMHPQPPANLEKPFQNYLSSMMTWKEKWLLMKSKLQPSSNDARLLPLPRALYFLYLPLRPVLWLLRQRKRQLS